MQIKINAINLTSELMSLMMCNKDKVVIARVKDGFTLLSLAHKISKLDDSISRNTF